MAVQLPLFPLDPAPDARAGGLSRRRRPHVELNRRLLYNALERITRHEATLAAIAEPHPDAERLRQALDEDYLKAGWLIQDLEHRGFRVEGLRFHPPSFELKPLSADRPPRLTRRLGAPGKTPFR